MDCQKRGCSPVLAGLIFILLLLSLNPCTGFAESGRPYDIVCRGSVLYDAREQIDIGRVRRALDSVISACRDAPVEGTGFDEAVFIVISSVYRDTSEAFHSSVVFQGREADDYILDREDVYVLFLSNLEFHPFEVTIEKERNVFSTSFRELVALLGPVGKFARPLPAENRRSSFVMIKLKPDEITPPCRIAVTVGSGQTREFVYRVHEINTFKFHIGVTSSGLAARQFKLEAGTVEVSVNQEGVKTWKGNVTALLGVHWPRDVDRFRPLWSEIGDLRGGFVRVLGQLLWTRMGIFAGLRISTDPLGALYAGMSYAITPDIDVTGGATWVNEIVPTVQAVGDIRSLEDLEAFLHRRYSAPYWFWGVSFAPGAVTRALGIGG